MTSLPSRSSSISNFYDGRSVFLTGATGMVGMAYIARLLQDTLVEHVYALVRGGESRLWNELESHLKADTVNFLRKSERITAYNGDITAANFGMRDKDMDVVRANVSIFIHAASSIDLKKGLDFMAQRILRPSIALAEFARSCDSLDLFVYISTAYSSTFVRKDKDGAVTGYDAVIKEGVNPIRSDSTSTEADLEAELSDLAAHGTTNEFTSVDHPFSYSYMKHLTERVLERDFRKAGQQDALLVFRPSVIAPAVAMPHPHYERAGSSPSTNFLAACVAHSPKKMVFATHFDAPSRAMIDVVPVDIVVNRLIAHTASKTTGFVHAVGGKDSRIPTETIFEMAMLLRQPWWPRPRIQWRNEDWKSRSLCRLARLFIIVGAAFVFEDERTKALWEGMSEADRLKWPLFHDYKQTINPESIRDLSDNVRRLIASAMEKSKLNPTMTSKLMCKSLL